MLAIPGLSPYSSSKKAVSVFAQAIDLEFSHAKHQIDVLSWEAGRLSTNMNPGGQKNLPDHVSGILNQLGKTGVSVGHKSAEADWLLVGWVPLSIMGGCIARATRSYYLKRLKERKVGWHTLGKDHESKKS